MIADYHVHTPYCGHAQGKIIQYVEKAIEAGLGEIGFSDHLGRYYLTKSQKKRYWDWGMSERDLARYFAELLHVREVYEDDIQIKIGLEIDFIDGADELLESIVSLYPFDFYLCSIHCLPRFGWKHLANYTKCDSYSLYKEYFSMARAALNSGMFHSLAHLDFIWRYIQWPDNKSEEMINEIDETLRTASQSSTKIEINANGYIWSQNRNIEQNDPFDIMLDKIKLHNTPITIGSDAHEPQLVAKVFPELITLLKCKGIHSFYRFNQGQGICENF